MKIQITKLPKNRYDIGGVLQSHGSDWSDGLVTIGAGGSHEENKYQGVQVGVDSQNVPNLVEENETIYNDYVYSNRITLDDEAKKAFHIGKKRDITYAEMSKKLEKEASERPNDPISKAALKAQLQELSEHQERQKQEMEAERAREAFEALSPEEQTAVMQQVAQQEQAAQEQAMQEEAMAQQQAQGQQMQMSPEEAAMMQQQQMQGQPMMGQPEVVEGQTMMAYGGKVNKFAEGDILVRKANGLTDFDRSEFMLPTVAVTPDGAVRVKADINNQLTAFDYLNAIRQNQTNTLIRDYLEEAQKDREYKDIFGRNRIHYYAGGGPIDSNYSMYQQLLEGIKEGSEGTTLNNYLSNAKEDEIDVIKYLFENGVDLDTATYRDVTEGQWEDAFKNFYNPAVEEFKSKHPEVPFAQRFQPNYNKLWDETNPEYEKMQRRISKAEGKVEKQINKQKEKLRRQEERARTKEERLANKGGREAERQAARAERLQAREERRALEEAQREAKRQEREERRVAAEQAKAERREQRLLDRQQHREQKESNKLSRRARNWQGVDAGAEDMPTPQQREQLDITAQKDYNQHIRPIIEEAAPQQEEILQNIEDNNSRMNSNGTNSSNRDYMNLHLVGSGYNPNYPADKDGGYDWESFFNRLKNYSYSKNPGNVVGNYAIDENFPLEGVSTIKDLENTPAYKQFTNDVTNFIRSNEGKRWSDAADKVFNPEEMQYINYMNALVSGVDPNSNVNLFTGDNNSWGFADGAADLVERLRNDQKGGIFHFTPSMKPIENINKIFYPESPGVWKEYTGSLPKDYPLLGDYSWNAPGKRYNYKYLDSVPSSINTNNLAATSSEAGKSGVGNETGIIRTNAASTYNGNRKIVPVLKSEWPRYVGLFGPAVGLGMMAAGIGKPNKRQFDAVLEGYNKTGASYADYKPIGNYLTYRPMDIWADQNRLNASSRATDRAIMNSTSPSKVAGLLASGYNDQLASGQLYRQALEYNDNQRKQVADFNRGTDMFNAQAYNQLAQFNASQRDRDRQMRAQLGMQAAAQKADMDAGWYNSIYGNVAGLFKGISDLGRENAERNMLARLAASGALGTIDPEGAMNAGLIKYANSTAEGGKIKRKKNKRRGLTI